MNPLEPDSPRQPVKVNRCFSALDEEQCLIMIASAYIIPFLPLSMLQRRWKSLSRVKQNLTQFQLSAFSPKVRAWREPSHRALISYTSLFMSGFLLVATAAELKLAPSKGSSALCSQVLLRFTPLVSLFIFLFLPPACLNLPRSVGAGSRQPLCSGSSRAKRTCKSSLHVSDLQLWPWYFGINVSARFSDWVWWITHTLNYQTFNKSSVQCILL